MEYSSSWVSGGCSAIELQDGNRLERRTLATPLEVLFWLIYERHVTHRVGFRLCVHRDPMPVTQDDQTP